MNIMNKRRIAITCTFLASLSVSFYASSKTLHLDNPDWQEIPGTEWDGSSSVIEMKGLIQKGDKYTFDLLGADLHYARIELNCADKRYRMLREGSVNGRGSIEYKDVTGTKWMRSDNNHIQYFVKYICES